tara:strand:- start:2960 stop:3127 length:168 start_codon:yes stop_codon:yes gene_type:complete
MFNINFYNKNTGQETQIEDFVGTSDQAIKAGRKNCPAANGWIILSVVNNSFMLKY